MQLNSFELECADFLATWVSFCNRVKGKENEGEILQEFVFGLWRLWKNKNEMVFKGGHRQPLEILELWKRNISEFRDARMQGDEGANQYEATRVEAPTRWSEQWRKPGFGTIKVNTGLLQAVEGSSGLFCHNAVAVEANAIRDALEFCIKQGFNTMIVEFDAKVLIQMIRKELSHEFSLECILGDIETLACGLELVTFEFVSR
ncbi:uncharacterized protein [Malus domestica]|uniref:uncharacterized protein n=1 Tax=Malus domestica TaxID=3750 RepID=UPI0010AB30DD|nr:uncharacterized protein LOC114822904 [Malus domestica]